MFELFISNKDGSPYWREYFRSMEDLNRWLGEEKTRSYWDNSFSTVIIDHTPPPPSQADLDAITQRQTQIATLKQRIRDLANQQDLAPADVKEAIFKLIKMKVLSKELD